MRFPLLWIASALAAGIFAERYALLSVAAALAFGALVILIALAFARANYLRVAWCAGLLAWTLLGVAATSLQRQALPNEHVTRTLQQVRIAGEDALRWRGRLRSDPLRMPWGARFEIELAEVEVAGQALPVSGGLRASYFGAPGASASAFDLRAGERVEALLRARPPRNFQNPGAFDARAQLARQGVHLTGTLRNLELLERLDSPAPSLAHRGARVRGDLLLRIAELFRDEPPHAAVLRAILLGDYSFIDHDLAETFRKTAAYHVLVISGLHVAALAAFIFWIGRRLRLSLLGSSLLTLLALAMFVSIVEDRPPIERAALMSVLVLAMGFFYRKTQLLNTIGAAVLAMLALRPDALQDPSFQLSFLAGAMIGALGLPLVERTSAPYRDALRHLGDVTRDAGHAPRAAQFRLDVRALGDWIAVRLPGWLGKPARQAVTWPLRAVFGLWDVFVISTAIQIGMLPVLAHYFHRVSLAGPIANIPAAVLSALLIPLGLGALAVSYVSQTAAGVLAWMTAWCTEALLRSVTWFGEWSAASYRIPGPPVILALCFFAAMGAVAWVLHSQAKGRGIVGCLASVGLLVTAALVAIHPFAPSVALGQLEVSMLDVGQGDAILVTFPNAQVMLLDGGGQFRPGRPGGHRGGLDVGEQVVSPYLWSRGVQRVDVVALSHAHQDHLDGLMAVLDNFEVGELWVGQDVRTPAFLDLLQKARAHNVKVRHRRRGDSFTFGGVTGVVLWPEEQPTQESATNNDSLVFRLEFGAHAFLLAGDIEAGVERELFAREDPLSADVLKVAHHGSRTSTTADFSLAVRPEIAVMSLAEANPFGHPHPQVLETLAAMAAKHYRTDRDGAVSISTDGRRLRVATFAGRQAQP